MRYLFVYEHLNQGGIETLIVRMCNWLVEQNHTVTLFVERSGSLSELLDSRVILIIRDNHFKQIFHFRYLLKHINAESIDCIYTFGAQSLFIGGLIHRRLKNDNIALYAGIYHPREFNVKGRISLKNHFHQHFFSHYITKGSHVFMSEEVKEGIEKSIQHNFPEAIIWPLAIKLPAMPFTGKPEKFKIISIGRYVEFKTYNLWMFEVIESLLEEGINVSWEVYGSGPLKIKMEQLSAKQVYQGCITINDEIPYDQIYSVLNDASVFIGMGTSILEVGAYGIPTIPAIAYNHEPTTYGYVYDLPYYCVGERLAEPPEVSIKQLITQLYFCSEDSYEDYRKITREYITAYSMDSLMKKFVNFARRNNIQNKAVDYPFFLKFLYVPVSLYSLFRRKLAIKNHLFAFKNAISTWKR